MTSYFHNGVKNTFFLILSNLARYNASEFHLYHPTTYQYIKTELKNVFLFRRDCSSKLYMFLQIFFKFFALCDDVLR